MDNIRIVKFIQFKLNEDEIIDIDVDFEISPSEKVIKFELKGQLLNLVKDKKIAEYISHKFKYLFAYSEYGEKITLYDVSFACRIDISTEVTFCQNLFLIGDFIEDISNIVPNKVQVNIEDTYPNIFRNINDIKFDYDGANLLFKKNIKIWKRMQSFQN